MHYCSRFPSAALEWICGKKQTLGCGISSLYLISLGLRGLLASQCNFILFWSTYLYFLMHQLESLFSSIWLFSMVKYAKLRRGQSLDKQSLQNFHQCGKQMLRVGILAALAQWNVPVLENLVAKAIHWALLEILNIKTPTTRR